MKQRWMMLAAAALPLAAQEDLAGVAALAQQAAADAQATAERIQTTVADKVTREVSERIAAKMAEKWGPGGREDSLYWAGTRQLDDRDWKDAAEIFDRVAKLKGSRADGALYWKAYAEHKQGNRDAALASLGDLKKNYAASRWMNDAKALEMEVQRSSGQAASPESVSEEDLKLYALNSLIHSEPDRAVPLLEKILASSASPRLKERALFVAAQSKDPKSLDLLTRYAKGEGNPDLQRKAIQYLGEHRAPEVSATLAAVYSSATDAAIKREVLRAYASRRDQEKLAEIARSESDPKLKAEANRMYIDSLYRQKNDKALIEMARKETDLATKKMIVERLSRMKTKEANDYLVELLNQ